ncbi:MAG TPA: gluconate 5-dehydrogenase, partial [Alphaproteobacteria bacterium]|nr:gluconate 5-dehydrogenase [Alphaproteobacteria bacterium]
STELTQPLFEDKAFSDWLIAQTPAGRWGQVDDLVGAAIYLSSPASDFMHGQVLYVDGGMTVTV